MACYKSQVVPATYYHGANMSLCKWLIYPYDASDSWLFMYSLLIMSIWRILLGSFPAVLELIFHSHMTLGCLYTNRTCINRPLGCYTCVYFHFYYMYIVPTIYYFWTAFYFPSNGVSPSSHLIKSYAFRSHDDMWQYNKVHSCWYLLFISPFISSFILFFLKRLPLSNNNHIYIGLYTTTYTV